MFGSEDVNNQHQQQQQQQQQNRSSNGSDQTLFELEHIDFSELFEDVEYKQLARQSLKTCAMDSSIFSECQLFCFFARLLLIMQQSLDASRFLRNWGILDNVLDYIIIERTVLAGLLIVMKASNSKVSFSNALYRLHRILLGIDDLRNRIFLQSAGQGTISKDIHNSKRISDKSQKVEIQKYPQEIRINLADSMQSSQQYNQGTKRRQSSSFLSSPSAPVSPQYTASEKEFLLVTYEIFFYAQKYARQFLSEIGKDKGDKGRQIKGEVSQEKLNQMKIKGRDSLMKYRKNSRKSLKINKNVESHEGYHLQSQDPLSSNGNNRLSSSSSSSSSTSSTAEKQEYEEEKKKMTQICELAESYLNQQDSSFQPRKKISSLDLSYTVQDTLVSFRKKLSDSLQQTYCGLKPSSSLTRVSSSLSPSLSTYSRESPNSKNNPPQQFFAHNIQQSEQYLSIYSPTSPEITGINLRSNSVDRELSLVSVNYLASLKQVQEEQQEQVTLYFKGLLQPKIQTEQIQRESLLGNSSQLEQLSRKQSFQGKKQEVSFAENGQESMKFEIFPRKDKDISENNMEEMKSNSSSCSNSSNEPDEEAIIGDMKDQTIHKNYSSILKKQSKLDNQKSYMKGDQLEDVEEEDKKKKHPSVLKIQRFKSSKHTRNHKAKINGARQFQRKRMPSSYRVSVMQAVIEEKEDSDLFNSMLLERSLSHIKSSKVSQGDEQQKSVQQLGTSQTLINQRTSPLRMRSSYFNNSQTLSNSANQMQLSLKLRSQSIEILEDGKCVDTGKGMEQVDRVEEGKDEDAEEDEEKKNVQDSQRKKSSDVLEMKKAVSQKEHQQVDEKENQQSLRDSNEKVKMQDNQDKSKNARKVKKQFETSDEDDKDSQDSSQSSSSSSSLSSSSTFSSSSSSSSTPELKNVSNSGNQWEKDKTRSDSNGSGNSVGSGGTVWSLKRRNGIQVKTVQKHVTKRGKEFDTVGVVAPNFALVSEQLREQEEIRQRNKKNRKNNLGNISARLDSAEEGNISSDANSNLFVSNSIKNSKYEVEDSNTESKNKLRNNREKSTSISKKTRKNGYRSSFISKIVSFFHQNSSRKSQDTESASDWEENKGNESHMVVNNERRNANRVVPLNGMCFYKIKDVNNFENVKDQQSLVSFHSSGVSYNTNQNLFADQSSYQQGIFSKKVEDLSSRNLITDDDDQEKQEKSPQKSPKKDITKKFISIDTQGEGDLQNIEDEVNDAAFEEDLKILFQKSSAQPDYDLSDRKNCLLNFYGKSSQVREMIKKSSLNYQELSLVVDEQDARSQKKKQQQKFISNEPKEINEEQFFDFPRESVNLLEYLQEQKNQTQLIRIDAQKYSKEFQILTNNHLSKWVTLRLAVQKMIYKKRYCKSKKRPTLHKNIPVNSSLEDDFTFDLSETATTSNKDFISANRTQLQDSTSTHRFISQSFNTFDSNYHH